MVSSATKFESNIDCRGGIPGQYYSRMLVKTAVLHVSESFPPLVEAFAHPLRFNQRCIQTGQLDETSLNALCEPDRGEKESNFVCCQRRQSTIRFIATRPHLYRFIVKRERVISMR